MERNWCLGSQKDMPWGGGNDQLRWTLEVRQGLRFSHWIEQHGSQGYLTKHLWGTAGAETPSQFKTQRETGTGLGVQECGCPTHHLQFQIPAVWKQMSLILTQQQQVNSERPNTASRQLCHSCCFSSSRGHVIISHHHKKKGECSPIRHNKREREHLHRIFITVCCYNCPISLLVVDLSLCLICKLNCSTGRCAWRGGVGGEGKQYI